MKNQMYINQQGQQADMQQHQIIIIQRQKHRNKNGKESKIHSI